MKKLLSIFTLILLLGCSSSAPPLQNLMSKELKPPADAALVYILRPWLYFGGGRSPDFTFNGQIIGEIENDRYLYFYAYPMELILTKKIDGSIVLLKTKLEAGKKYYFKFSMLDGYSLLSQQEGTRLLNELNMSANFKPYLLGSKPSNIETHLSNNEVRQEERKKDYLKYDEISKFGVIKYSAEFEKRDIVIGKIEDICKTKNVALITDKQRESSASYLTLDESIENNVIEIKFQCIY